MAESSRLYLIVAGVDYSEVGDLAVEQAFDLAKRQEAAEVHLVNVVREAGPGVFVDSDEGVLNMTIEEAADKLKRYAEARVSAVTEPGGFRRVITHIARGPAAEQIVQLASDLDASLLVVGTHGRKGVERLILGSVAQAVVKTATCPVFIARPKVPELRVPEIEPPCPRCVEARRASGGEELWCEQHRERHGRRHTYHYVPRNVAAAAHSNMPLVAPLERNS